MKTKYYLRGLGIGILFTAFLFIVIIIPNKDNMTDEEIISEAKKLGMIEKEINDNDYPNILATGTPIPDEEGKISEIPSITTIATPKPTATLTPTPKPTATLTPTPKPTATLIPTPKPTAILTPTPKPTATPEPTIAAGTDTVRIEVYRGMTSEQLSEKLQKAGLVDSDSEFNSYLIRNNYADYINIGVFKVQKGLSYKDLAELFTKSH